MRTHSDSNDVVKIPRESLEVMNFFAILVPKKEIEPSAFTYSIKDCFNYLQILN